MATTQAELLENTDSGIFLGTAWSIDRSGKIPQLTVNGRRVHLERYPDGSLVSHETIGHWQNLKRMAEVIILSDPDFRAQTSRVFPNDPSESDGRIGPKTWRELETLRSAASISPFAIPSVPAATPYPVDPAKPYGPRWKNARPPGLPSNTRLASRPRGAMSQVENVARMQRVNTSFVAVIRNLALGESQATFGLPAHIFDARPPSQRPAGKSLITAWGVFQFNRDAWTALIPASERSTQASFIAGGTGGCCAQSGCVFPWDATPEQEIELPIRRYAQIYQAIKATGGNDVAAARAVRLFHASPSAQRRYLSDGKRVGFSSAWLMVAANRRHRIDQHLSNAGVLHEGLAA